ncbi:MAG: hypothetical protein H6Q42_347 [Deltaproteobacteria bacterium]|nr:hypothetical protein [Deltaproteobacteria bacterium]
MKCGQIQKMLPACLDGILSKTENALVEKHLEACDSCRAAFGEYQHARQLIRNLEAVEPPPGFAQRVMARIEEEEGKKAGILRKLFYPLHIKVPIQAVVTIGVAVLAIQAYRSVEPRKETSPQFEITASSGQREEPAKEEDRQKEAVRPAKKQLPTSDVIPKTGEGIKRDAMTIPPPASAPPVETRLREEKATVPPAQIPGSAAAPREAEKAEFAAAGKKVKMEAKTTVPGPSPKAASLQKKTEIGLTLQAVNPASAGEKVQAILQEIRGERIERIRLGEKEIVTADLNPRRVPELVGHLNTIGEMKEKPRLSQFTSASISIRIEIFKK